MRGLDNKFLARIKLQRRALKPSLRASKSASRNMDPKLAVQQASSPEQANFYHDFERFAANLLAPKFYVKLTSRYQFSDQYNDMWNESWAEYDAFEER